MRHEEYMKSQLRKQLQKVDYLNNGIRKEDKIMELTMDKKEKLLKVHNDLKEALQSIDEMRTLTLKDINGIEDAIYTLRREFEFQPPIDSDGDKAYWSNDWVMKEEDSGDAGLF